MDMAYLRAHPQHLPTFLTHQRIRETPVGRSVRRLTLDDGTSLFAKTLPASFAASSVAAPSVAASSVDASSVAAYFAAEAAGLDWLRSADAVPIPEVIAALPDLLVTTWIESGTPTPKAAEDFGRGLAALHRSGADTLGAAWPGYIGPLPLDNTPSEGPWGTWFGNRRLLPYLRISADRGALPAGDVTLIEQMINTLVGYAQSTAPARIHGDLWPGNLMWGADGRCWLVDPAAQGGHRETDLATLAMFGGVPHQDRILAAYREAWPLDDGWADRVALHQLHLLLAHTAAFGAGYRDQVRAAAEKAGRFLAGLR
ncbi:fructosamine kinase family protein [Actinoplanes rectilineatus]|uniref:fructosamine kinase family protein n=1 Tax=Actinoplanes rectilineatus TaxID=113571 RepID=UPI0005F27C46|nr:fructosamine kinase family protein [Actinoplanes rectilineatus]